MSSANQIRQVQLPPQVASQLRGAVEEALKSLGNEAAVLIMYYAKSRHEVEFDDLPSGVEELDGALTEVLGGARRMVVNQCAGILSKRLGIEVAARTEKLSDIFRQVSRLYQDKMTSQNTDLLHVDLDDAEETTVSYGANRRSKT
jgi:hypothetical protein